MGTGAVGGADDVRTTHRPRMPRWLAVALTLAVALGLSCRQRRHSTLKRSGHNRIEAFRNVIPRQPEPQAFQ